MVKAERVIRYTKLPPEADQESKNPPHPSWPEDGDIVFDNVSFTYHADGPLVLKDINCRVKAGEKVPITNLGETGSYNSHGRYQNLSVVTLSILLGANCNKYYPPILRPVSGIELRGNAPRPTLVLKGIISYTFLRGMLLLCANGTIIKSYWTPFLIFFVVRLG